MEGLATLQNKQISYHTKAVGVTFEGRQEVLATLKPTTPLRLVREPENEYDPNAVAIEANVDGWKPVGYIAANNNTTLAKEMDGGTSTKVSVSSITGGDEKNYGLNILISYRATNLNLKRLIPDIGTGYVMFDEANHAYYDEEGNQMISGSLFEKAHKPVANLFFPAKATAKAIDCKPNQVTDLWNLHGELAMQYGTLIHKGLEVYFDNSKLMKKIDQNKDRVHHPSNFMPHAIGHIVSQYINSKDKDFHGKVQPELFVRAGNRCGYVDLLEEATTGHILHDYKFIKELKVVNYKGYGKYNDYTLQQNFYREILEDNGLTIKKMVLDTYSNNVWSEVPVELVKLEKIVQKKPTIIGEGSDDWLEQSDLH